MLNNAAFLPDEPDVVLTGDEDYDSGIFMDDEDILMHESDNLGISFFEAVDEDEPEYEDSFYDYDEDAYSPVNTW